MNYKGIKIIFRDCDKNNKIDMFNKKLYQASKGRFELRKTINNKYYLYDYDFREISWSKKEIQDILECMNLYKNFKEEL